MNWNSKDYCMFTIELTYVFYFASCTESIMRVWSPYTHTHTHTHISMYIHTFLSFCIWSWWSWMVL